jgi:hypothetical protein
MKLTDVADESPQDTIIGTPRLSFSFNTQANDGSIMVEKTFTFSYWEGIGEWSLYHYKVRQSPYSTIPSAREWTLVEDRYWNGLTLEEMRGIIDIPQVVLDKLDSLIEGDLNIVM